MRKFPSVLLALLAAVLVPGVGVAQEPAAETQATPEGQPAPSSGSIEPSVREAGERKKLTTGKVVQLVILWEGLFAAMSGAAAYAPGYVGVVEAVSFPLAYAITDSPPGDIWPTRVFTVGLTGLGLYNALVLSKDRYSHIDRFWQNVAAWNASVAGGLIAGWLTGSNEWISPRVSFMVGPRADRLAVLVSGRF